MWELCDAVRSIGNNKKEDKTKLGIELAWHDNVLKNDANNLWANTYLHGMKVKKCVD